LPQTAVYETVIERGFFERENGRLSAACETLADNSPSSLTGCSSVDNVGLTKIGAIMADLYSTPQKFWFDL
jgi:hypothetical protein